MRAGALSDADGRFSLSLSPPSPETYSLQVDAPNRTALTPVNASISLLVYLRPGQRSLPSSGGKCIGFVVNRTLWKVSLRGGAPVRLAGAPNVFYGAAWGDAERTSGHLIYRQGGALLLHRVDDRTFEPVGKLISVVPAGTRDELVASFAATPKGNRG